MPAKLKKTTMVKRPSSLLNYTDVVCQDCNGEAAIDIDVVSVLVAYEVRCPMAQRAITLLLQLGQRPGYDAREDLLEVIDCVSRATKIEEFRNRGKLQEYPSEDKGK